MCLEQFSFLFVYHWSRLTNKYLNIFSNYKQKIYNNFEIESTVIISFTNYSFTNYTFTNYTFTNYTFTNYAFTNYTFINYVFTNYTFNNYVLINYVVNIILYMNDQNVCYIFLIKLYILLSFSLLSCYIFFIFCSNIKTVSLNYFII